MFRTARDSFAVAARAASVWVLGGCLAACDQPAPKCNVSQGAFWAKYTLVDGDGACAQLTGEELDVQSYYMPRSKTDTRPDFDKVSMAIQPMTITGAIGNAAGTAKPSADDVPYAMGRFTTTSPTDDYCLVPELSAASLHLDAVPAHAVDMCTTAPDAPAYDVRYEFSRIRVYYTPAASGTQFEADLTYTQDGCTARYKVSALFPIVSCGAATPAPDSGLPADTDEVDAGVATDTDDADGGAAEDCPVPEPSGPPMADDSLCASPSINPDYKTVCDSQTMMCVLANDSPSLK